MMVVDFQTIKSRHPDIHKNQIIMVRLDQFNGFQTVPGFIIPDIPPVENGSEEHPVVFLIIHNQVFSDS